MRRCGFLAAMAAAAMASSMALGQQPSGKLPRVGILSPAENAATPIFEAFRQGLRELGYIEGRNIILEYRFAHNDYLQVASGAGIVGLALLALLLATIGRAVAGSDPASAAVRAALVVLAVGALFDFAWHLPALGITAGWIASLSGRRS